MVVIRLASEDAKLLHRARATSFAIDLVSNNNQSMAADFWSVKIKYGSTLDDDQHNVDAVETLSAGNLHVASDYSSEKDEVKPNAEVVTSMLGLQSYWDS